MWRHRFRWGARGGMVLAIAGGLGIQVTRNRTAVGGMWWILIAGGVVFLGSLVGLVFAEESAERRGLLLRLLAGFITLSTVLASAFFGLVYVIGCGMSSPNHVGWGCREASVYWPDLVLAFIVVWVVAGGLVWLALRTASTDRP